MLTGIVILTTAFQPCRLKAAFPDPKPNQAWLIPQQGWHGNDRFRRTLPFSKDALNDCKVPRSGIPRPGRR